MTSILRHLNPYEWFAIFCAGAWGANSAGEAVARRIRARRGRGA